MKARDTGAGTGFSVAHLAHGLPLKAALCVTSVAALPLALWGSLPGIGGSLALGLGLGALTAGAASLVEGLRREPIGTTGVLPLTPRGFISNSGLADRVLLLSRLDRSISVLGKTEDHLARRHALEEARGALFALAPELRKWSGETRLRVYVLLRSIAGNLSNPRYTNTCLEIVATILQHGGKSGVETVKSTLGNRVKDLCGSGYFLSESLTLDLLKALDSYSDEELQTASNDEIMSYSEVLGRVNPAARGQAQIACTVLARR